MASFAPVSEQMALLTRGVVDLHVRTELEQRLEESRQSGRPLRVKFGLDPTRPDLHFGHAVPLAKLRQFQDLGHTAILLIGEFTAMVGDPTGANTERPRLERAAVQAAAKTYTEQAFKILDPSRVEIRANAEWLDKLTPVELIELMAKSTVSRMLDRNDFAARFQANQPIHQHEFLYPLLQGYDSVALDCDVELGGQDQLFNLLVGRDLMPKYGKRAQVILTTPILEGIDARLEAGQVVGKKMSKSADNYVGLTEDANAAYRKIMQVDDDVIFRYFELLSAKSNDEIGALKAERAAGRSPLEIKALFAAEMLARLHGEAVARAAKEHFDRVYSADAVPTDVKEHVLTAEGDSLWLAKALAMTALVKSSSEGRRLVEQGGVEVDKVRVTDPQHALAKGGRYLLKVGSKNRRFAYVVVA